MQLDAFTRNVLISEPKDDQNDVILVRNETETPILQSLLFQYAVNLVYSSKNTCICLLISFLNSNNEAKKLDDDFDVVISQQNPLVDPSEQYHAFHFTNETLDRVKLLKVRSLDNLLGYLASNVDLRAHSRIMVDFTHWAPTNAEHFLKALAFLKQWCTRPAIYAAPQSLLRANFTQRQAAVKAPLLKISMTKVKKVVSGPIACRLLQPISSWAESTVESVLWPWCASTVTVRLLELQSDSDEYSKIQLETLVNGALITTSLSASLITIGSEQIPIELFYP